MSSLKILLKMPADKLDKDIDRHINMIESCQQKIEKIEGDISYYRLIINPPLDRKRKLDLISVDEHKIEEKISQVKMEIKNLEVSLRGLEKELLTIDHRNCLALFDVHKMEDVIDNHTGIVRFQRCDRCGYTTR